MWQPGVHSAVAFWFFDVGSSRTCYEQTTNKLYEQTTNKLRTNYEQIANMLRTNYEQIGGPGRPRPPAICPYRLRKVTTGIGSVWFGLGLPCLLRSFSACVCCGRFRGPRRNVRGASPCHHHAITMPTLCHHHPITIPSPCHHHATTMPPPCHRHAITMPSPCHHHPDTMPPAAPLHRLAGSALRGRSMDPPRGRLRWGWKRKRAQRRGFAFGLWGRVGGSGRRSGIMPRPARFFLSMPTGCGTPSRRWGAAAPFGHLRRFFFRIRGVCPRRNL